MTITEKILARASGKQKLSPGDVVFAKVDKVMMHDVSGPGVIKVFSEWEKKGLKLDHIWNPDKVWVTEDHFVPAADRVSADNIITLSNFTKKYGIKRHFKYGLGQYGICHTISPLLRSMAARMAYGGETSGRGTSGTGQKPPTNSATTASGSDKTINGIPSV